MNERNREIATGGENLGSSAGAQAGMVFAEGDIADIMQAILDPPVAAN
jgi:GT2 family glycosyltransferase